MSDSGKLIGSALIGAAVGHMVKAATTPDSVVAAGSKVVTQSLVWGWERAGTLGGVWYLTPGQYLDLEQLHGGIKRGVWMPPGSYRQLRIAAAMPGVWCAFRLMVNDGDTAIHKVLLNGANAAADPTDVVTVADWHTLSLQISSEGGGDLPGLVNVSVLFAPA